MLVEMKVVGLMQKYTKVNQLQLLPVLFVLLFTPFPTAAQEINADVQVNRNQVDGTSLNYLDNFADELEDYINEYNWIQDNFQSEEDIDLKLQINLLEVSNDFTFDANIIIRTMRPIYNTVRQTNVFLFNDENWTFNYTPNRSLVHDELRFDAIATLIDFYVYVTLGFDYDSFSPLGGSPYFSEAQNLVSLAQTTASIGWERSSRIPRNRPQLIADLLNPNYQMLRRAIYTYHRKGLDLFLENPEQARQNVLKSLEMIQDAKRQTTSNLLYDTFFNAKYLEIVSVFEDAPNELQLEVYDILSEIDPNHLTEYRKLQ
jgi:hypothetical protein